MTGPNDPKGPPTPEVTGVRAALAVRPLAPKQGEARPPPEPREVRPQPPQPPPRPSAEPQPVHKSTLQVMRAGDVKVPVPSVPLPRAALAKTDAQFRRPTSEELGLAPAAPAPPPQPARAPMVTDVQFRRPSSEELGLSPTPSTADLSGASSTFAPLPSAPTAQAPPSSAAAPSPRAASTFTLPPPPAVTDPRMRRPSMESLDPPLPPARVTDPRFRPPPMESLDPPVAPSAATDPRLQRPPASLDAPSPSMSTSSRGKAPAEKRGARPTRAGALRALVPAAAAIGVVVVVLALRGGEEPRRASVLYPAPVKSALAALWRDQAVAAGSLLPPLSAAVASVGSTVTRGLPVPPFDGPGRFVVMRDREPRCFALPDGTVVVSGGLLARLRSEAELAAVLAHVRAHVSLGHLDRLLDERRDLQTGVAGSLAGGPPADGLAAAAVDETAVRGAAAEAAADVATVRALQVAAWDARAWRTASAALAGTAWASRHAHPDREAVLDVEEQRRLPGSNLLLNDTGRQNVVEYQARILEPLATTP